VWVIGLARTPCHDGVIVTVESPQQQDAPESDADHGSTDHGPLGLRLLLKFDRFILYCLPRPVVYGIGLMLILLAFAGAYGMAQLLQGISVTNLFSRRAIALLVLYLQLPLLPGLLGVHVIAAPLARTWAWTHPVLLAQASIVSAGAAFFLWIDYSGPRLGPLKFKPELPTTTQVLFIAAAGLAWSAIASFRLVNRLQNEEREGSEVDA